MKDQRNYTTADECTELQAYMKEVRKQPKYHQNIEGLALVLYSSALSSYQPQQPPEHILQACLLFSTRIIDVFMDEGLIIGDHLNPVHHERVNELLDVTMIFLSTIHQIATGEPLDIITRGVMNFTDTFTSDNEPSSGAGDPLVQRSLYLDD